LISTQGAEATVFETGSNQWKQYTAWPPKEANPTKFFFGHDNRLATVPSETTGYDEYVSDPADPVPYIDGVHGGRDNQYIVTDQRFASKRPDVLTYQTGPLTDSVTLTGRLKADIWLSSTGSDADLIVKVIDVLPGKEDGIQANVAGPEGYQRDERSGSDKDAREEDKTHNVAACMFRSNRRFAARLRLHLPTPSMHDADRPSVGDRTRGPNT